MYLSRDQSNSLSNCCDNDTQLGFICTDLDERVINQIAVDLPRCHAYDSLLASPIGQCMLRRVLVATLLMKQGLLDYTQVCNEIFRFINIIITSYEI